MTDAEIRKRMAVTLGLFTAVCAAAAVVGYVAGEPDAGTDRFYLRSDGGAVLFEHARHVEQGADCVACHHELAGEVVACAECHDDPDYVPGLAAHAELLEHHERACAECHEVAPAEDVVSCRECHEDEMSAVYHAGCSGCHLTVAPDRFADTAGEPLCRACHLR
jgi:hypothetical protein